ncbi:MAG: F420-0:Gamma-glutamyl ligase [Acidimicrobiales bacterium]
MGSMVSMVDVRTLYRLVEPALRPVGNAASFSTEDWSVSQDADRLTVSLRVRLTNLAGDREVMVYDVVPQLHLLSRTGLDRLVVDVAVRSADPTVAPRADRYWTAFVVKPHHHSDLHVTISVDGPDVAQLYALCLLLKVQLYGAEGLRDRVHHVVLPLGTTDPAEQLEWRPAAPGHPGGEALMVAPVPTPLLTPIDDPLEVVVRYALPHAQAGDVVAIGETPLAIMQNRFRHPAEIRVSALTRRLCYFLSGKGSLGTAPGLQALIDLVGLRTVLWALVKGFGAKLANRDGTFYRTAGEQSRLIDDVTGTLAPYDRFVVLGPADAAGVCERIWRATGIGVAVVDANDLGMVDVLAASDGVARDVVVRALRTNPAGNGAERTPLVLIRGAANGTTPG